MYSQKVEDGIVKETLEFLKIRSIDVDHHRHLILFPAEVPIISWKDIDHEEPDSFIINHVDHRLSSRMNISMSQVEWKASSGIFFDFYSISLVQYFSNFKGHQGLFPNHMDKSKLKLESLVLDREYVDRL